MWIMVVLNMIVLMYIYLQKKRGRFENVVYICFHVNKEIVVIRFHYEYIFNLIQLHVLFVTLP